MVQRTSWHNADLALTNLKKQNLLSLKKLADLRDSDTLTKLLKPAGFYQTKPKRLLGFCSFITDRYKNIENFMKEDLKAAREKLLDLNGIGQETADTILLYALDKPTFIIDEYTKRLVKREGLSTILDYENLQNLFEDNLPQDPKIYQYFHCLIIVKQKGIKSSVMKKL